MTFAARSLSTGAGLLGSGTHPAAVEGEAEITDKERYERIHDLLGDAVATPVGGLHIHVGMPDAETAIRAFNGAAPPSAAAAGAGRQLALPAWARHRSGLGSRGHDPRLAAIGGPPRDA